MLFSACTFTTSNGTTVFTSSRNATINDIYLDTSSQISFDVNYTMIPNVDIKNLKLEFKFYDSNNKHITTKEKYIGNVAKGITYPISISFAEFSFFDLLKINYTSAKVLTGTVYS